MWTTEKGHKGKREVLDVRGGLDLDHQYLMTVETTMHINIVLKHYCIFLQMQHDRNATVWGLFLWS